MIERPRPVDGHRELRWRWWLMRVDLERQCYRFVHDIERYDAACLFADVAVRMLGGDFVVWDAEEKRPLYDSRKMRGKFTDDERATTKENSRALGEDERAAAKDPGQ